MQAAAGHCRTYQYRRGVDKESQPAPAASITLTVVRFGMKPVVVSDVNPDDRVLDILSTVLGNNLDSASQRPIRLEQSERVINESDTVADLGISDGAVLIVAQSVTGGAGFGLAVAEFLGAAIASGIAGNLAYDLLRKTVAAI